MSRILNCLDFDLHKNGDFILIRGMLFEYCKQRSGINWEEYREKLLSGKKNSIYEPILSLWETILKECFRNGYVFGYATGSKIIWNQITTSGKYHSLDLCTLCERPCQRREDIDTGKLKWRKTRGYDAKEKNPCWDNLETSC